MTMTVTVPAGGAMVRFVSHADSIESGGAAGVRVYLLLKQNGTTIKSAQVRQANTNYPVHVGLDFETFIAGGSHTFKLTGNSSASGFLITSSSTAPFTFSAALIEG
jgi:hypothetical protein